MNRTFPERHLSMDVLPHLSPLFQKGIRVEIGTGCNLESLFSEQWGLSSDYIRKRISTLFLNGKPVDDMSTTTISEGAVLALSSAMPGLVGAVMRRGGYFSSLRSGITYRENNRNIHIRRGNITVKLFNLLIEEIGPGFLLRGFLVNQDDLAICLGESPEGSHSHAEEILIIADPGRGWR